MAVVGRHYPPQQIIPKLGGRRTEWVLPGTRARAASHGIHFTHTIGRALQDLPGYLRQTEHLTHLIEECGAKAVVCDFEPLSSRAALESRTPLIIVDNQTSVFCRSRRSGKHRALVQMARLFTAFWYGPKSIFRCHAIVTVSLSPERPGLSQQVVVPPRSAMKSWIFIP